MPVDAPPAPTTPAAAPAPAPSAPPSPAPAATPPSPDPGGRHPTANLEDAYSNLEKLAGQPDPQSPRRRPDGKFEKKAPEQKNGEAEEAEAGEQPAPQQPPKPGEERKPIKAATLKEALERAKARNAELEKQLTSAKPVDMKNHPDVLKLTEQLRSLEKQRDELDQEVRFSRYEAHPEYKAKYLKPFEDAYLEGAEWAKQLRVTDENGEERQATEQDFDMLMRLFATDPVAGTRKIREMFGDMETSVLVHAKEIMRLNSQRTRALDDYKKNGSEREKQQTEFTQKQRNELTEMFATEREAAINKFPQWFKPIEGDEDGNRKLERGMELADAAFGAPLKDKDGKVMELTPQQRVKLHAAIRNKAGGFDRAIHLLTKEQARTKELEEKLKEYEGSEPGPGERRGKPSDPGNLWDKVDADLMKRAR